MVEKNQFDSDLVKNYPQSNKKIQLQFHQYNIVKDEKGGKGKNVKGQTTFISPFGLEFQGVGDYPEGTLLKININLPDYWSRKQKFVQYDRVDVPADFKILAKVVKSEDVGKRGRKKLVLVQTVNIDEVDEQVLKSFLQEAK